MPSPRPPSLPSAPDPEILSALNRASTCDDVRAIQARYPWEDVNRAWKDLPPVQRAALLLVRHTNGTIFHDLTAADFREPHSL